MNTQNKFLTQFCDTCKGFTKDFIQFSLCLLRTAGISGPSVTFHLFLGGGGGASKLSKMKCFEFAFRFSRIFARKSDYFEKKCIKMLRKPYHLFLLFYNYLFTPILYNFLKKLKPSFCIFCPSESPKLTIKFFMKAKCLFRTLVFVLSLQQLSEEMIAMHSQGVLTYLPRRNQKNLLQT